MKKIHEIWRCTCGFKFKIEDNNKDVPIEAILNIVLKAHKKEGHQLKREDLTVKERQ